MRVILNLQAARPPLTSEEILELVGEEELARIKTQDPNPLFRAWVIAQEGTSDPVILGDKREQRPITWGRVAVQAAYDVLERGVKFFYRHNEDNSHHNREPQGEVIAKTMREIDGKMSTIAIGYFPPKARKIAQAARTVSMEFKVIMDIIENGARNVARGIEEITAIALGGPSDIPAFRGAVEVATVQAFNGENMQEEEKRESEVVDFRTLKKTVRYRKVPWRELYAAEDIIGDIKVKDGKLVFHETDPDLQHILSRAMNPILTETEKLRKQVEETSAQVTDYRNKFVRSQAVPTFEELIKDMKAEPAVVNYAREYLNDITVSFDGVADEKGASLALTKAVREHIERAQKEVDRLAKLGFVAAKKEPATTPARPAPSLGDTSDAEEENPLL